VQFGLWLQERRWWLQLGSPPSLRVDLGYHLAEFRAKRARRNIPVIERAIDMSSIVVLRTRWGAGRHPRKAGTPVRTAGGGRRELEKAAPVMTAGVTKRHDGGNALSLKRNGW
jgi:hypothetical protein